MAETAQQYCKSVLLVDDGSSDLEEDFADKVNSLGVAFIQHDKNRGKGAAIQSAAEYLLAQNAKYMITIDGDGQHYPEDIAKFLPLLQSEDNLIVVGCRDFDDENVPKSSRFGRNFANFWLRVETGQRCEDCQSGFRAYPVEALAKLKVRASHYDYETEVLTRCLRGGLVLRNIEIKSYYPPAKERVSHFRKGLDNFRISLTHTQLIGERLFFRRSQKLVTEPSLPVSATRGKHGGIAFFIGFMKLMGYRHAANLTWFVAIFYALFDGKACDSTGEYIECRFKTKNWFKKRYYAYRIFVSQGHVLLQKLTGKRLPLDKEEEWSSLFKYLQEHPKGGVILLSSHFGAWQSAIFPLAKLGRKVYILEQVETNSYFDKREHLAENFTLERIDTSTLDGGMFECLQVVESGNVLCIMGDRGGDLSIMVDFPDGLGVWSIPLFPWHLAYRLQCPVVPFFCVYDDKNQRAFFKVMPAITSAMPQERKPALELFKTPMSEYVEALKNISDLYPYQMFNFKNIGGD